MRAVGELLLRLDRSDAEGELQRVLNVQLLDLVDAQRRARLEHRRQMQRQVSVQTLAERQELLDLQQQTDSETPMQRSIDHCDSFQNVCITSTLCGGRNCFCSSMIMRKAIRTFSSFSD